MNHKEMHKRFDEKFPGLSIDSTQGFKTCTMASPAEIKLFIESERERERERIVKLIESCSDFADNGDTLKNRIINLIKNK